MKKKWRSCIGPVVFVLLMAPGARAADNAFWEDRLAKVREIEAAKEAATVHETYRVDSITVIRNADNKIERQVESKRKVTRQGKDPDKVEFTEMSIDGRKLSQKEMEAELAKSNDKLEGKSPLSPEEMPKYQFEPGGNTTCADIPVWIVLFHPKTPDKSLGVGKAYIRQDNNNVIRLEFATSVLPAVVQNMKAVINFFPHDDLWLPDNLEITLHVKVVFIFTLADKQITVQEKYHDYLTPSTP
jgi:hypothetical protein